MTVVCSPMLMPNLISYCRLAYSFRQKIMDSDQCLTSLVVNYSNEETSTAQVTIFWLFKRRLISPCYSFQKREAQHLRPVLSLGTALGSQGCVQLIHEPFLLPYWVRSVQKRINSHFSLFTLGIMMEISKVAATLSLTHSEPVVPYRPGLSYYTH